jgi:hypothetical protein
MCSSSFNKIFSWLFGPAFIINSDYQTTNFFSCNVPYDVTDFIQVSKNKKRYCLIKAYKHGIRLPSDCSETSLLFQQLEDNEYVIYIENNENENSIIIELSKNYNITKTYALSPQYFKKHSHAIIYKNKGLTKI